MAIEAAFHISGSPCVALVSTWPSLSVGTFVGQFTVHCHSAAAVMLVMSSMLGLGTLSQASHAIGVPTAGWTARDGK